MKSIYIKHVNVIDNLNETKLKNKYAFKRKELSKEEFKALDSDLKNKIKDEKTTFKELRSKNKVEINNKIAQVKSEQNAKIKANKQEIKELRIARKDEIEKNKDIISKEKNEFSSKKSDINKTKVTVKEMPKFKETKDYIELINKFEVKINKQKATLTEAKEEYKKNNRLILPVLRKLNVHEGKNLFDKKNSDIKALKEKYKSIPKTDESKIAFKEEKFSILKEYRVKRDFALRKDSSLVKAKIEKSNSDKLAKRKAKSIYMDEKHNLFILESERINAIEALKAKHLHDKKYKQINSKKNSVLILQTEFKHSSTEEKIKNTYENKIKKLVRDNLKYKNIIKFEIAEKGRILYGTSDKTDRKLQAKKKSIFIFALALFILFILPFALMLNTSFKTQIDLYRNKVTHMPDPFSTEGYGDAMKVMDF